MFFSIPLPPLAQDNLGRVNGWRVYADIDGEAKPVGTAFFLAMPIADKGDAIVVVTALHVISNIEQRNGKVFLRVNTRDGAVFVLPVAAGGGSSRTNQTSSWTCASCRGTSHGKARLL